MKRTPTLQDPADLSAFPDDFVWGAATSAFQIEGAAAIDGRADSIWDVFCRKPGAIVDGSDGAVACDHYHRYAEDLALVASLGFNAYRFSVAWPRVQPDGRGAANPQGLDFYDRLVDTMLARGLQPHLTLNHWDLPQALQQTGGWGARETTQRFVDYAQIVVDRLGDRLASLATHNEPWIQAILGNEVGIFAPGLKDRRLAMQVAHHLLLSHGMTLQALRAGGFSKPMGIVLNLAPIQARTEHPDDVARARLEDGRLVRWFMDPLYHGQYPDDVWRELGDDVPSIAAGDMEIIANPGDFLGVNYYTRTVFDRDGAIAPQQLGSKLTDMGWEIYPQGLTELLLRLHRDYRPAALFVTENGAAFADVCEAGVVADDDRIDYLRRHIEAAAAAIRAGVPLRGYMVWSLLDNFEWASGYAKRFGIVHVDYATQIRTPKNSAHWLHASLARRRASQGG